MASTHCAFCDRYVHMTSIWAEFFRLPSDLDQSGNPVSWLDAVQGIARCDNCGRTSMGLIREPRSNDAKSAMDSAPDASVTWVPAQGASPDFPDVPTHIAAAAREAHASASIGNTMSAILMARTVVEATAKSKGITSGNLVTKIDAMQAASVIREDTKDAAHEIRHFGNDMAHGDIEDRPSVNDASEVLDLMDEVLNEVFQGPARTARIRAKRTGV